MVENNHKLNIKNMKTGEKIYTQHADHTEWLSKLKFYTDEISIMKGRLGELASKNSHQDVLAQVEHFQNQFIVQKNNIDEISHTIKLDESAIEKEVNKNIVAVDHREMPSHSKEKEAVDAFEKNFNELRAEFKTFAAKWM
jgi:hypothetical protein